MRPGGTVKLLAIIAVCAILLVIVHFIGSRMTPSGPISPGTGRGSVNTPEANPPAPRIAETEAQRAARLLGLVRESADKSPRAIEQLRGQWTANISFVSTTGEIAGTSLIYVFEVSDDMPGDDMPGDDFTREDKAGTIRYRLAPAGVTVRPPSTAPIDAMVSLAPLSGERGGVISLETAPGSAFIVFEPDSDGNDPGRLRRFMATDVEADSITLLPTMRDLADLREEGVVNARLILSRVSP